MTDETSWTIDFEAAAKTRRRCEGCDAPEEWRQHPKYRHLWVSNLGHARTEDWTFEQGNKWGGRHIARIRGKPLTLTTATSGGYPVVTFRSRQLRVHVLMLECFVGPRPKRGWHGCHGDDDPVHNCLKNLRWDTPDGNRQDTVARNAQGRMFDENNPLTKIPSETVAAIRAIGHTRTYRSIAHEFGISPEQASRIVRGLSRAGRNLG